MNFFFCTLVLIFVISLIEAHRGNDKCDEFNVINYLFAASLFDVNKVKEYKDKDKKFDLGVGDYDNRMALHLAASENHLELAKYLLDNGVPVRPKDRWNYEPLDDATRYNHSEIVKLLNAKIKQKGK